MNPHETDDDYSDFPWDRGVSQPIQMGVVDAVEPHDGGTGVHAVKIIPEMYTPGEENEKLEVEIPVSLLGDVTIPEIGDRIIYAYRENGRAIGLAYRYSETDEIPEYKEGERVIGHPVSDSYIRFNEDGTLSIEDDGNTKITLDTTNNVIVKDTITVVDNDGNEITFDANGTADATGTLTIDGANSSEIVLDESGTITVTGDSGNSVALDGSGNVVLNGGSSHPITDISTSTDDNGNVTSISTTTSDSIFVP